MTDNESDFEDPLKHFLGKTYAITTGSIFGCVGRLRNAAGQNLNPQPTGGFVSQSFNNFKHKNFAGGRGGIPKKYMEDAFVLSQYDEMSQHHFCYMESFHAMMADLGLATPVLRTPVSVSSTLNVLSGVSSISTSLLGVVRLFSGSISNNISHTFSRRRDPEVNVWPYVAVLSRYPW